MLNDDLWFRLKPALKSVGLYQTHRLRMRLEGIFWKLRTGAPWRDLPDFFGAWQSTYNQFNRWSKRGVLKRLFEEIRGELDPEWGFMDSTIIRAHQHASGARHGEEAAIGRSRGGRTTKVHMLADAHGNPVDFEVSEGQVHDMKMADALLEKCEAKVLINDKGYDSESLREKSRANGITPCIPLRKYIHRPNPEFDADLYKLRHLIENLFARLKHFRSIATRYEKLKRNYASIWYLGCVLLWLKL